MPEAPLQRGLHKIYAWVWVHGDWDAETARREVDAVTQAVEREPLFYDGLVLVHLVEIGMVTDSPWFRPHPGLYLNKTMADLYAPLMAAARRYGIELHGFITAVPSILTAPDVNRTSEVPPRSWFSANVSAGTPMGPLIDSSTDIAAALGLAGFSTDDESTGSPRLAPGESEAWFAFHDAWGKGLRSRGLVLSTAVQVHVHRTVLAQAALTARRPVLRHASALPCLTDESQAMSWMHVDDREDKSTQAGPRAPPRVARASEKHSRPCLLPSMDAAARKHLADPVQARMARSELWRYATMDTYWGNASWWLPPSSPSPRSGSQCSAAADAASSRRPRHLRPDAPWPRTIGWLNSSDGTAMPRSQVGWRPRWEWASFQQVIRKMLQLSSRKCGCTRCVARPKSV